MKLHAQPHTQHPTQPHARPLWFKRKRYGWGWYPVTWQGWLVIVDFVVLVIANTTRLNIKVRPENTPWFIGETLVMVAILILVCYRTGESPRWQWGGDKEKVN